MEVSGRKASQPIKSPSFKSRIPQKVDGRIATSPPTNSRFQSKIPRSSTSSLNCSPMGKQAVVQRQISEPLLENRQANNNKKQCDVDVLIENYREKLSASNGVSNKLEVIKNINLYDDTSDDCNEHRHPQRAPEDECESPAVHNGESYGYSDHIPHPAVTTLDNPADLETTPNSLDSSPSSTNQTITETSTNEYIVIQPVYHEIEQQLSSNSALTSTPTTTETTPDLDATLIDNTEMETETHAKPATNKESPIKNGFSKTDDFPDEDFERTEHDNDDYTTTTTTEFEKDGKMVRTTETINYTTDRNIKTRVTTTEKIVTIPYGQQLDLTNPEITSSTTVRSKYLQTMLQNREFEGDKEIKAETLETIETDVQTDKADSNENTPDPDLDTVLVIVETLDEVRTIEPKIRSFAGDDGEYAELIGVLKRSLTKFENIEPKGKESVEQKRQNGIDYIQRLIQRLDSKLDEKKTDNKTAKETVEPEQQILGKEPPQQQSKIESSETPHLSAEPVNTKKERKRSTLKKHLKFGNKDKQNGELKEKKKKKKLCVIS